MLNIMHFQGDELFEAMQNILSSYSLVDAFEQDLKLLEEYVSFDQLKAENIITIEEKRFHSIRQEVIVQVPSLLQEHVSQTIEKMRYKTVYDCLRPYDNVVQKIGERLQKPIAPIRFIGPEIYVDAQRFQLFFKSLIHIFRNAIDHGIETLEERIAFEKEQNATISCTWSCNGNRLVLQIADDGQGVDSEKIRSKIVEKQLLDQDSASELNEEQLFAYIFHEQFSTKDEDVTLWSGRGVGLSFVHEVVKSFGGSVTLESEKGKGTTFILDIEMD
jgi:chemotaxis protein histidine kinase CheA